MRQARSMIGAFLFVAFAVGAVSAAPSGGRNAAVVKALDAYESQRAQAVRQVSSGTAGRQMVRPVNSQEVAQKMAEKLFSFEMGFETYSYKYEETVQGGHFMDLEGTFSGIYSKIVWRPDLAQANYWKRYVDHFILDTRVGWAKLDYDGGVTDNDGNSYPAVASDIPDMVIEFRGLAAKDFAWRSMTVTPYAGFGYRHLSDDSTEQDTIVLFEGDWYNIGPAGYKRKSDYYYLPIGVDVARSFGNGWKVGLNAEFDYLIYGEQLSELEYTGTVEGTDEEKTFPNITNEQNQGYGLRTSLRLERNVGKYSFSVEPFYRYWNIEDSKDASWESGAVTLTAPGVIEPSNTTSEIGMKMGMLF